MRRPSPTIADHGPNSLKMCICVTNIHIELTPLNGLVPVTDLVQLDVRHHGEGLSYRTELLALVRRS